MEDTLEKLNEDADTLVEFAAENDYLDTAFYNIFGERLMHQGYVDAGYILEAYGRGTYYSRLKNSKLQKLFTKSCMVSENVEIMINYLTNIVGDVSELERLEEEALVFWIFLPYLAVGKQEKRKNYLLFILQKMLQKRPEDKNRDRDLTASGGVIFDRSMCSVEMVDSIEEYTGLIFSLKKEHADDTLFYRGHSRLNYLLRPGIKREKCWLENEDIMYQELLVRCAKDFIHCHTHLDYLVEMQHYGLPTRLLDITENPLVALYFACCSNSDKVGEVFALRTEQRNVKYAKSDTVAILSALPTLSYEEQNRLYELCKNGIGEEHDAKYQMLAKKLAAEVKSRNPAFEPRIRKKDLLGYFFVIPIRNNERIVKQEGSFIICGISGEQAKLEELCCSDGENRRVVLLVKNKEKILKELDVLSVNRASLFPEIDDVAEYIKEKYQNKKDGNS
ncbi:MAG: FRG domain-containing protein [Lachnospiraceae bacterium]|nr:FRG domain-containing protein [Lachnospiraceae bacterium]